jgi:hypothetical protein
MLLTLNYSGRIMGKLTAGRELINTVNKEVDNLLHAASKVEINQKVMISGMAYLQDSKFQVFFETNFLKAEIASGKGKVLHDFINDMHVTLKKRFDVHVQKVKLKDVKATNEDILRAGWAGSHGEIRALDKLLKEIDPSGKLGDAIFDNIIGYNRFLRQADKIQPPCVHCYFITKDIKYLGF